MDKTSLSTTLMKLYDYFRYVKRPTEQQVDIWHGKIEFIPVVALDWIFDELTEADSLPRNLPKTFIKMWYLYRKAHPEKYATEFEYCEECFGHGIHMFEKLESFYDPPAWVSYVARCSRCNNWKQPFGSLADTGGRYIVDGNAGDGYVDPVPRVTKQELIDKGFRYLPLSNPKAPKAMGGRPRVEFDGVSLEDMVNAKDRDVAWVDD